MIIKNGKIPSLLHSCQGQCFKQYKVTAGSEFKQCFSLLKCRKFWNSVETVCCISVWTEFSTWLRRFNSRSRYFLNFHRGCAGSIPARGIFCSILINFGNPHLVCYMITSWAIGIWFVVLDGNLGFHFRILADTVWTLTQTSGIVGWGNRTRRSG